MCPTQSDVVQQLLQGLSVSLPNLDSSIGSPVRGVLDVVAEVVAEAYADQYLLTYQYDIDTKSGADLDSFVATFGFSRFPAKRATGTITFSRVSNAPNDIFIGTATQVATANTPPVIFNTMTPVIMAAGTNTCSVPIQAQLGGSSGNVSANTITTITSNQMGISNVINSSGCTGGTDAESDDQLRARFKATVFRALTGTLAMFTAVGLDDPDVSQVNVIGANKTYNETIQILGGTATSSVQNLKYLYANTSVLGIDIYGGQIFTPGAQYTITIGQLSTPGAPTITPHSSVSGASIGSRVSVYAIVARNASGTTVPGTSASYTTTTGTQNSNTLTWTAVAGATSYDVYLGISSGPLLFLGNTTGTSFTDIGQVAAGTAPVSNTSITAPVITSLDSVNVPDGTYNLQFDYLPTASRNDPVNGITNRIDMYVNGDRAVSATQVTQWINSFVFNRNSGDSMNVTDFVRDDGTLPEVGNYFIPYSMSPVIDPANPNTTYTVSGNTYTKNVDFWHVDDVTAFGLGPMSRSGIEWRSLSNGGSHIPTPGAPITVNYTFNQIPLSVQQAVQNWRLVGTDVMVHQAKILNLNLYLGIILASSTYSQASVLAQIETSVSNYFSSLSFDDTIQVSQILAIVQGIPGVTAVRFLTSSAADSAAILYPGGAAAGSNYAIQSVNSLGALLSTYATTTGSPFRAIDVPLTDDTLPALANVYFTVQAQNTFGAV